MQYKSKNKTKSLKKNVKPKNKTCKNFCEKVFLPERERVEMKASIKLNSKTYKYKPIHQLRKTNKSLATLLKRSFLKTCDDIYCQKKCKGSQNKWFAQIGNAVPVKLAEIIGKHLIKYIC